jgi:hypothetical protein
MSSGCRRRPFTREMVRGRGVPQTPASEGLESWFRKHLNGLLTGARARDREPRVHGIPASDAKLLDRLFSVSGRRVGAPPDPRGWGSPLALPLHGTQGPSWAYRPVPMRTPSPPPTLSRAPFFLSADNECDTRYSMRLGNPPAFVAGGGTASCSLVNAPSSSTRRVMARR